MKNLGNCVMGGVIAWLMIAPVTWAVDYGVIVDGGDWGNATTWTPSGGPPSLSDRAFVGGVWVAGQLLNATVNLSSGSHAANQVYVAGWGDNTANGTLNLSGGSLFVSGPLYVAAYGTGVVYQTGGSVYAQQLRMAEYGPSAAYHLSGAGSSLATAFDAYLGIGGGPATFTMAGGTMNVGSGLYISYASAGTLNQSGGTITAAAMRMGEYGSANSTYQMTGGQLIVGSSSYVGVYSSGSHVFNQSGGVAQFNDLFLGYVGAGTYNLTGGELNANSISINNGSFSFTGGTLSANTINFNLVNNGGILAPGQTNTTGTTTISGSNNYTQGLTATLALQLGGTTQGVTYDWLNVGGTANLNGTLSVSLVNSFTPAFTDVFTNVTAGTLSGVFANAPLSGQKYDLGGGHHFVVTYTANHVILSHYEFLQTIPEPGIVLLLGIGGWLMYRRTRRY